MTERHDFDSPAFQEAYHCDTPLGCFCSPQGTEFRLWAPTAQAVTLRLYPAGDGGECLRQVPLCREDRGLWRCAMGEDLDGFYYDYLVTVDGVSRATADPYARACGLNGGRSMVLNMRRADPEGWAGTQKRRQAAACLLFYYVLLYPSLA